VARKILYLALRGNKYTEWRKLNNENFKNLDSSNGYVKVMNSRGEESGVTSKKCIEHLHINRNPLQHRPLGSMELLHDVHKLESLTKNIQKQYKRKWKSFKIKSLQDLHGCFNVGKYAWYIAGFVIKDKL
jgi:hypothetical protein